MYQRYESKYDASSVKKGFSPKASAPKHQEILETKYGEKTTKSVSIECYPEVMQKSLNPLLRRAAVIGTTRDIDDFLHLGARINDQDEETKSTALHLAVQHQRSDIAKHLISKNASRYLKDINGLTPSSYNTDKTLSAMLAISHLLNLNNELKLYLFTFFTLEEMDNNAEVCKEWRAIQNAAMRLPFRSKENNFNAQHKEKFYSQPRYIQYIITKRLVENHQLALVKQLLQTWNSCIAIPGKHDLFSLEFAKIILTLQLATESQCTASPIFLTQYGLILLASGLLSPATVVPFIGDNSQIPCHSLFTREGYLALKNKWITVETALSISPKSEPYTYVPSIDKLFKILSEPKLPLALSEGTLTQEDLKNPELTAKRIDLLFGTKVIKILKEKLLSFTAFIKLCENNGELSVTKFEKILGKIYIALSKRYLSEEQLFLIKDLPNLFSDNGIKAFERGVIKGADVIKCADLSIFNMENGLEALQEKLINLEQVALLSKTLRDKYHGFLQKLLENGLPALREKLITVEQAATLFQCGGDDNGNRINLKFIFSRTGMDALREKKINLADILKVVKKPPLESSYLTHIPEVVVPTFRFIFLPHSDRLAFWYNQSPKPTGSEGESKEKNAAAKVIQKKWRNVMTKKRNSLFGELQVCMQKSDVNQLEQLFSIKKSIDAGKLTQAAEEIKSIKPKL